MWMEEEGFFHTIGVINSSPDSKWCHISFVSDTGVLHCTPATA